MKTSKEFFERLQSDEAFAQEIMEKTKGKSESDGQDYKAIWIPLAAEYGYELKGEELDEMYEKATAEMTDEELGKVAGGTTPFCVLTSALITSAVASGVGTYVYSKVKK